jgi:hypothetical protein
MSNSREPSDGQETSDRFELIAEFEDEILNAADLIDICLEENLVEADRNVRRRSVLLDLESVLYTETEDDRIHNLAQSLMNILSDSPMLVRRRMSSNEGSKELFRFVTKLRSKYGAESTRPNRISRQGPNYWSDIHMEMAKRGPSDAIGMNYRVVIGHSRETEISMDLNSNLLFCMNLLDFHERTVEEFGPEAVSQFETVWLDDIQEQLNRLKAQVETHENHDSTDNHDN